MDSLIRLLKFLPLLVSIIAGLNIFAGDNTTDFFMAAIFFLALYVVVNRLWEK